MNTSRHFYYKLIGTLPAPCSMHECEEQLKNVRSRTVARTELPNRTEVSTVFLCIDHAMQGEPLLFETMIFGGPESEYQERYHTWDQALEGHERAVKIARKSV